MELSSLLPSPHADLLTALAYSPSSTHLLLASADSTLSLFRRSPASSSVSGGFQKEDRWKAHDGPVGGVAWAGEEWGVVCASWGWDRRVCVWREDVDEKRNSSRRLPLLWSTLLPPSHGTPQSLSFAPAAGSSSASLLLTVLTSTGQLVVYAPSGAGMADWFSLISVSLPTLVGGGSSAGEPAASSAAGHGGQLGKMLGGSGAKGDAGAAAVGASDKGGKSVRRLSWCREHWWGLVFAATLDATGAVYIFTLQNPSTPPLLLSTLLPPSASSAAPSPASSPATQTALAWAPSCGRSYHLVASGSRDGWIRIWRVTPGGQAEGEEDDDEDDSEGRAGGGEWKGRCVAELGDHGAAVTQLEWNVTGTVLSSSADDGTTRLWKATYANRWECAAVFDAEGPAGGSDDEDALETEDDGETGADAEMA